MRACMRVTFIDANMFLAIRRWKFHEIAMEMLSLLVRYDSACSVQTVRVFVDNTVHDSLHVRKVSAGRVIISKTLGMQCVLREEGKDGERETDGKIKER